MRTKIVAFWRYDHFPYILGGTVTKINDKGYLGKGWVETEEYGAGSWFKPINLLPEKQGIELLNQLSELEAERAQAMEKVSCQFDKKLDDLLPFNR